MAMIVCRSRTQTRNT